MLIFYAKLALKTESVRLIKGGDAKEKHYVNAFIDTTALRKSKLALRDSASKKQLAWTSKAEMYFSLQVRIQS